MTFHLREARRALAALSADPDDTEQAIRAINAMAGNSGERLFKRFVQTTEGVRILREKRELYDLLSDLDSLKNMPENSLGHAIWSFYTTEEISAQGLKGASESASDNPDAASRTTAGDMSLFARRSRELHDIFHVMTGYGRDMRGEIAVLAFTFAQTMNTGIGYMVFRSLRNAGWNSVLGKLIRQAFWRGRRCKWLVNQEWELLLAQPLALLREDFNLGPAPQYEALRSPGAPVLVAEAT